MNEREMLNKESTFNNKAIRSDINGLTRLYTSWHDIHSIHSGTMDNRLLAKSIYA